jgi:hypothetical protein
MSTTPYKSSTVTLMLLTYDSHFLSYTLDQFYQNYSPKLENFLNVADSGFPGPAPSGEDQEGPGKITVSLTRCAYDLLQDFASLLRRTSVHDWSRVRSVFLTTATKQLIQGQEVCPSPHGNTHTHD